MNKTKRYFLAFITALIFAVAPISAQAAGFSSSSSSRSFSTGSSSSKSYSSPAPKPSYSAPKPSAPSKPSYSSPKPSQKPSYSSSNATKPKPTYAKPKPSSIPPNTSLAKGKDGKYVSIPKNPTRFGSGRGGSYVAPKTLLYHSPRAPRGISASEWNRMPRGAYSNLNSPVYWANPTSPYYYLFLAQYGNQYNTPVVRQKDDGLSALAILAIVFGSLAAIGAVGYGVYRLLR